MTKCDVCEINEADYDVSNRATNGDASPWVLRAFICGTCATAVIMAVLHKLGLTIIDLSTLMRVPAP